MLSGAPSSRQGGTLDLRRALPGGLVGRSRELDVITGALEDACSGRARRVLLVGEPGIGKSALLEEAVTRADRMTVLRATGTETESDLAFAGLLGVLRPILGLVEELPEPQRRALEGALALGRTEGDTRFAVGAATLGLLSVASESEPVLIVLDDVQWIDRASLAALVFAARRLDADQVVFLAASRPGGVGSLGPAGFELVELEPLDHADAERLLDAACPALARRAREVVLGAAHGNPLALLDFPEQLTEAQLGGEEELPQDLAAGVALQRAYAGAFESLSNATRGALIVAALSADAALSRLESALSEIGANVDDFVPAESAGLVSLTGARVTFRHPLVSAALVGAASPSEVRMAHSALVAVSSGVELARHRAAAAVGPDEGVARQLEDAAEDALRRAAPSEASSLLSLSAQLSPDLAAGDRRELAAARAAWVAGDGSRTVSLSSVVIERSKDIALRARARRMLGLAAHQAGDLGRARALLLEAADELTPVDDRDAFECLVDAFLASIPDGPAAVGETAPRVVAAASTEPSDAFFAELAQGVSEAFVGRSDADIHLNRAVEILDRDRVLDQDDHRLWVAPVAGAWLRDPALTKRLAGEALEAARSRGILGVVPALLKFTAGAEIRDGNLAAAYAAASEGAALAEEVEQPLQRCDCLTLTAWVEAIWGLESRLRGSADVATRLAEALGVWWYRLSALGAVALYELGSGRAGRAAELLEELRAEGLEHGVGDLRTLALHDLVEAHVRAGQLDLARKRLQELLERAVEAPPSERATAARAAALLADDSQASELFTEALALHPDWARFELARTHLCFGERLRRSGERRSARAELEAALEIFEQLAARPWAERCRQELVASGRRLRAIDPATREELTPQELQVALQVARGLTNREIAQALFLSPKTVEFHLTRIYRKLDLHARAELVERFADQVERDD